MSQWQRLGLGVKFVLVSTLLLTVMLGLSMVHQTNLQQQQMRQQLIQQSELLGRFVAVISTEAILAYDFSTLNAFVTEISQQQDLVYALVLDSDGNPITSYFEPGKPAIQQLIKGDQPLANSGELYQQLKNHPRLITLTFPVIHGNLALGQVVVALDTFYQQRRIRLLLLQQLMEYLAVMLLLGMGIYMVFRHYVLRPVHTLNEAAKRVAQRDFDHRIIQYADDELGELTCTFNHMMQEIRSEQSSLRKLSSAVEQSPASVVITDTEGTIEYVNRAFCEITGYSTDESVGQSPRILKSGLTPEHIYSNLWQTITRGDVWTGELHNRRKDGRLYWEFVTIAPIRDAHGVISHYVGVKEDISIRKEYEERLFHQANFDSLTGLPNRVLALDRLEQMLRTAHRSSHLVSVMFMDLDNFKNINDTLGHEAGDRLLIEVSKRLLSVVRENDTVARLGGDEFLILLSGTRRLVDGEVIAEKLLRELAQPVEINGRELIITPSIGLALYPQDGTNVDLLLRNADAAMYEAKAAGRNTYRHYTAELNAQIQQRLELEHHLRHALELNELELYYQPVVDTSSRALVGAEVLLRWNSVELGAIMPDRFIPLAEEGGQILEIGNWVLEQACRSMREWQRRFGVDLRLSINISSRQVCSGELLEKVQRVLNIYNFDPTCLELEITEHLLLDNSSEVLATLRGLRQLGVGLSIDDFGTGYSALSYLKQFPLTVLKIDRSFVRDSAARNADATLIRSMVGMAQGLGMEVVGEGVETREQYELLLACEVDRLQGFYFSKALPEEEFVAYMEAAFAATT